jgi:antitoxin VapB
MALNIKNPEVERLATEVAELAHETKTEAIRKALEDRRLKLKVQATPKDKTKGIYEYLERYIWPYIPDDLRGKGITKEEREEILGYGPDGV